MALLAPLLAGLALAVPTVECRTHVESPGVTAEQRREALRQSVRVNGVILWGLRNATRREFGGGRGALTYKAGLGLSYGRPMRIAVAMRDRNWLALDYDGTRHDGEPLSLRDGAPVMRFVPCAPDTPRFTDKRPIGNETGWAGGFIVTRPGCATLRLRRDGESAWRSTRVGFGRRCR
jgi:hypothetical protein